MKTEFRQLAALLIEMEWISHRLGWGYSHAQVAEWVGENASHFAGWRQAVTEINQLINELEANGGPMRIVVTTDGDRKKLVRVPEPDTLEPNQQMEEMLNEGMEQMMLVGRDRHYLNMILQRLVALEKQAHESSEAIASLDQRVQSNRQDYDDHLTLGTYGSAIATALFLLVVAYLVIAGGFIHV